MDLISLRLCHISFKSSTRSFSKNEQRIKIRLSCQSLFNPFSQKGKNRTYSLFPYALSHISYYFFFHYIQIKRMPDYYLPYLQFNTCNYNQILSLHKHQSLSCIQYLLHPALTRCHKISPFRNDWKSSHRCYSFSSNNFATPIRLFSVCSSLSYPYF